MATYLNGRVPASALVTVEDNDQLTEPAASAYLAMKAAAAFDGVTLFIVEPAGAYRSFEVQTDMHEHPERYNLNPDNIVTLAKPGYSSHGLGNRVDLNAGSVKWAIANGAEFGFTREFGAADPNHFKHNGGGAGGFAPPLEEEMKLIQANNRGAALVGAGYYKTVTEEERDGLLKVGVALTAFSEREFDVVKAACTNGYGPAVTLKTAQPGVAPTAQEIAEAVVDEQAERLAE